MSTPTSAGRGRSNRTRLAVLGMLASLGSASGYELGRRIEQSIGHFWQESFGQLYPMLNKLAEDGLVARNEPAREGGRARTEYRITARGRTALADWLRLPPARHVERNELLIRVFFASHGDIDDCIEFVIDSQADARRLLRQLRETSETLAPLSDSPDYQLWVLTIDYGMRGLQAHLEWCDLALDTLRSRRADPSADASRKATGK